MNDCNALMSFDHADDRCRLAGSPHSASMRFTQRGGN